jgi:hypothetical protein
VADPKSLLPWIIGGAIGAGGLLQGLHWKSSAKSAGGADLETQLQLALEENELLKRENESLRSLAQGGGEMAVPPEMIDRIEKEIGLAFLSNPVVHRIAGEELRDRVTASIESRMGPSGIDDRQEAYQRVGWLRPNDKLLHQLASVRAVGARGWFDDASGEAWVTDRFVIEEIPDQAVLLRLLTRILLHQHFPPPAAYPGDDAARAREALHQGAAAGSESRFLAANARAIGFLSMRENPDVEQLMASLPPFIQSLATFPVVEGKALADTLYVSGNEPFLTAFRNPPQTTRAILLPASPPAAPAALDLPKTREEAYLTESAGQLGLRLWLEATGDVGLALEVASAWKNDRYALVPDGEASTAVVWDIELDEVAATDRLLEAAESLSEAMNAMEKENPDATPMRSAFRVSPTRVRYVNPATQSFLNAVRPGAAP